MSNNQDIEECQHSHANNLGCPECGVEFGANPELVKALESLILFTKPSRFNAAALANAYRALNATNSVSDEAERNATVKDIHSLIVAATTTEQDFAEVIYEAGYRKYYAGSAQ